MAAAASPPPIAAAAAAAPARRSLGGAAAASSVAPAAAAAAVPSSSSSAKQRNNVAASGAAAAAAIDVDSPDSDWSLPELSALMAQPHYRSRLTPATAPVFNKYNQAELDALVGEVMKFILARNSAGQITTHKSILDLLGDRAKHGANSIIADARRRFMSIYGWELKELDKRDVPASSEGGRPRGQARCSPGV